MNRLILACLALLILANANNHARADPLPGSFAELLDSRSITTPHSWRTHQASGYDRNGGYHDSGNFIRTEPGQRHVLMEATGPGVIDRMWFTYKKEVGEEPYDILIYIDNFEEPAIRLSLEELFDQSKPPFQEPLAGYGGDPQRPARYSYLPIGFKTAARVILRPTTDAAKYNYRTNAAGETIPHVYYQITYRKFPTSTAVQPFSWNIKPEEQVALQKLSELWRQSNSLAQSQSPGSMRSKIELTIAPRQSADLFRSARAGTITGFRIETTQPQELRLEFHWDDEPNSSVSVPFGPFFACPDFSTPDTDVTNLWVGHVDNTFYSRFPMPFHKSAHLRVISTSQDPIKLTASIDYNEAVPSPEKMLFHAKRYDYDPPSINEEYVVLDTIGRGTFVGIAMDRPGHMEGDDRFFVDGEAIPSIHGTGTEDFFNFAWGLTHVGSYPLHGITQQYGRPHAYRFHTPSGVPFNKSLKITWEHGHNPTKGVNFDLGRYSGVVFYYQQSEAK